MPGILNILLGLLGLLTLGGLSSGGDGDTGDIGGSGGSTEPETGGGEGGGGISPDPDAGGGSGPDTLPASAYDIGWGGLSVEEQLMVELINQARMDPLGEIARSGNDLATGVSNTAVQPLAVHHLLAAAARGHSEDMEARDFFAHTNPDGDGPGARASDEGYSGGVWENIGAKFTSASSISDLDAWVRDHHENLWQSDGHQQNLMRDFHDYVGLGYADGDYSTSGGTYWRTATFVTEKFGNAGDQSYLTGVVMDDHDNDDFYDMDEGQGDVRVTAWDGDGNTFATSTWGAGGYSLALPDGTYTVRFEGGDLAGVFETSVTIAGENEKLDVHENDLGIPMLMVDESAIVEDEEEPLVEIF